MSFNSVTLSGAIGSKDIYKTQSGSNVINISLATNKARKTPQGDWEYIPTWHKVVAFGKTADYLIKREPTKGDTLTVINGKLENQQSEKNGTKYHTTKIICDFNTEVSIRKKQEVTNQPQEDMNSYIEADQINDIDPPF